MSNLTTAYAALDKMFKWGDTVPKQSKRHKAAIALLGQHKKPGSSMAVVLDQAKLLSKADYQQSAQVQDFVQFIDGWLFFCR